MFDIMNDPIVINNELQAKKIFEHLKKFYENNDPNIVCSIVKHNKESLKKNRKETKEFEKSRYHNDPEYRERKKEQARLNSQKKKNEKKSGKPEKI